MNTVVGAQKYFGILKAIWYNKT